MRGDEHEAPLPCLEKINDFEWAELVERFGDLMHECPELAIDLVDIVRADRLH